MDLIFYFKYGRIIINIINNSNTYTRNTLCTEHPSDVDDDGHIPTIRFSLWTIHSI